MLKFKPGDRVKVIIEAGFIFTGEITLIKGMDYKVLPDGDYDWDYWYWPEKYLELIEEDKKNG